MAKKPNGLVLYEGPSMLDGSPIVVIATGMASKSNNVKTGGGLIQTWILRADVSPTEATNSGADASICGDCPHRGTIVDGKNRDRSCYVTVFQAPLNVWKSYHRGIYPKAAEGVFVGRMVRLGAYGDPAAVPMAVWDRVMAGTIGHTGYTHQWKDFPELAAYCMASCDNEADRAFAGFMGFRTFRVASADGEPMDKYEIVCPASAEAGHLTTCDVCKACGGTTSKAKVDIVIRAHGSAGKVNAYNRREAA